MRERATACLAEDDLLELARGGALGDAPELEAHLADCAACSALLVALVAGAAPPEEPAGWGALAGRTLGPYHLEAQIGAGAMGAVYRARDQRLGRNVAIKVLPAHLAGSAELARRLGVEARAAGAIAHPNVVTIFDVGHADGVTYVVAELVEGESLRSVLDRGRLPRAVAQRLARDLARGLAAAHAQGVIHRDLKPENLLVSTDGALKILDFGLAKLRGPGFAGEVEATEPGAVFGTVGYMAPEQARGEPADARSDLFSAGAILYELATGRRAFGGASHAERLSAVLRDTPPIDPTELDALAPVIARCLEKDPRRRFQSAQDLAWVLDGGAGTVAPPAPRPSRRTLLAGGGALALAVATGVGGYALGRRRRRLAVARQPHFRQLTYRHGRVMSARFTRDGGTILYGAAWDGAALATYAVRLEGGVARVLDVPEADVLAVSPRGEVALSIGRRFVGNQSTTGALAVAPLDDGVPRRLADDVQEADFAPDGSLAIVRPSGHGFQLELAGRVLLDVPGWITHARVSPDGTRVACLVHDTPVDDRGDVAVVDVASGAMRTLSAGWASAAGLAWDPRGDRIWFTAARDGAQNAVHTVTLDGRVEMIVQTPGRLRLHDLAADRRAAVTVDAWRLRTLVGGPDRAELDVSLSEFSLASDLSGDGRTLLLAELGGVEASVGAYLRPVDGGPSLHVGAGLPLALSPSGTLVAARPDAGGGPALVVYSTTSGDQPPLGLGALAAPDRARWIDERTLLVSAAVAGGARRLWRVDLGRSEPSPLGPDASGAFELDPARDRAGFVDAAGRVVVVDVASGAARTVPGKFGDQVVCGWLADGAIVVRTVTTPLRLTRVDPITGAATAFREIAPPPIGLKAVDAVLLRPDGGLHVYSYGQELSQLFLMTLEDRSSLKA